MIMTFVERTVGVQRWDTVKATVICETLKGALLSFNNNLVAFAYTSLPKGAEVWATIKRVDYEQEFILMSIDSVLHC